MVFSELITNILTTRNINARQLGEAIGVTGQTISNLKAGRVLKPDAKTCEAILSYCKSYGIDTSELNWNDVIRGYFLKSKYASDYEWISDVDENANICLRHKKCRRITTVPIMSLDGVSTPCISCWIKSYMAQDAYSITLNSYKTEFPIRHNRCGHTYNVSYEQIKQKKYFCPVCYGNKLGENDETSYGSRQDYRFISDPERITPYKSPVQPYEELVDEIEDDTPLSELSFEDFLSAFDEKPRKKVERTQLQENEQRKAEEAARRKAEEERRLAEERRKAEEARRQEEARQQELEQRKAEREARRIAVAKRRADRARRREEIRTISAERNFSVEYQSSPYGDYSLDPGEIALLCNQCGKEVVFDFDDPVLLRKINNLTCGCKTSGLQADLLVWTTKGNLAWCADLLRVISLVDLTTFNGFSFDGSSHFCFPEEGDKEVFFAADPSNSKYAYAFVMYPDEIDEWLSKYLLFKFEIASWGSPQIEVEIMGRWPYYYEKLYEAICQNIDSGKNRVKEISDRTFNCYISAYDALSNAHSDVWAAGRLLSAMEGLSNTLNKLAGNECASKDAHLQDYLDQHMCPVCKKMYTNAECVCSECGYNGYSQQDTDGSFTTSIEEERRKAEEARRQEEARRKAEEEEARRKAEKKKRLAEERRKADEANAVGLAKGMVVDAKLEDRGPVATLIVQHGTLKEGDKIVIGTVVGRVRTIIDYKKGFVKAAKAVSRVKISGLSGVPNLGDTFEVVTDTNEIRKLAGNHREANTAVRHTKDATAPAVSLNTLESAKIYIRFADHSTYFNWLSSKVSNEFQDDLIVAYELVQRFAIANKLLNKPLLETTDVILLRRIQDTIRLRSEFNKPGTSTRYFSGLAMRHYIQYVSELEEERRKVEETRRQEEIHKKAEEESRRKAEEECRLAEERRRAEEAKRQRYLLQLINIFNAIYKANQLEETCQFAISRCQLIDICTQITATKQQEEAQRKAEKERRLAEEHRKAEEARRKAEEEARQKAEEEARRKAEEECRLAEERRKAEEARRQEEARRKAEEDARRKAEEEKRAHFRNNNRCQHCGGEFRSFLGLFGKKCRACNRPKDY